MVLNAEAAREWGLPSKRPKLRGGLVVELEAVLEAQRLLAGAAINAVEASESSVLGQALGWADDETNEGLDDGDDV